MSRRWWTSPDGRIVYVGWDRALQQFFLSIVTLCGECGGLGEEFATEVPCVACMGEGTSQSTNLGTPDLEAINKTLSEQQLALPAQVRTDLEADRAANAGDVVHDYGHL
jgi:DnaJ-class molecular chaperone